MANRDQKQQENISGKFYVDTQCIDCDLCRTAAPSSFERQNERGYSYVYKQPANEEELKACLNAMTECPVEAIGADGDLVPA